MKQVMKVCLQFLGMQYVILYNKACEISIFYVLVLFLTGIRQKQLYMIGIVLPYTSFL